MLPFELTSALVVTKTRTSSKRVLLATVLEDWREGECERVSVGVCVSVNLKTKYEQEERKERKWEVEWWNGGGWDAE